MVVPERQRGNLREAIQQTVAVLGAEHGGDGSVLAYSQAWQCPVSSVAACSRHTVSSVAVSSQQRRPRCRQARDGADMSASALKHTVARGCLKDQHRPCVPARFHVKPPQRSHEVLKTRSSVALCWSAWPHRVDNVVAK